MGEVYYPPRHQIKTRLTPSEWRCIQLAIAGLCNKRIGSALGVQTGTVKAHLYNAMTKIGCHTRLQLYNALREGVPEHLRPRNLSEMQLKAVKMLRTGLSDEQVAHLLGVCVTTYKGRLQAARNKLGISSRVELLRHVDEEETCIT